MVAIPYLLLLLAPLSIASIIPLYDPLPGLVRRSRPSIFKEEALEEIIQGVHDAQVLSAKKYAQSSTPPMELWLITSWGCKSSRPASAGFMLFKTSQQITQEGIINAPVTTFVQDMTQHVFKYRKLPDEMTVDVWAEFVDEGITVEGFVLNPMDLTRAVGFVNEEREQVAKDFSVSFQGRSRVIAALKQSSGVFVPLVA